MSAANPGKTTHLPPIRIRDDAETRTLKNRLVRRLAERGIVIRPDVAAWMTVSELAAIWRAAVNACDRYIAERHDYEDSLAGTITAAETQPAALPKPARRRKRATGEPATPEPENGGT